MRTELTITIRSITDMEGNWAHRQECDEKADDIIAACRAIYPGMHTFEMWAKKDDRSKPAADKDWNKLSLKSLFLGK